MVRAPSLSVGRPRLARSDALPAVVVADRVEPTCGERYLAASGGMHLHRREHVGVGRGLGRSCSSIRLLRGGARGRSYQRARTDRSSLGPVVISAVRPATPGANLNGLSRHNAHCSQLDEPPPRLLAKLRILHNLCERHGITLSIRHLPTILNFWADLLSRRRDTPSWSLPPRRAAFASAPILGAIVSSRWQRATVKNSSRRLSAACLTSSVPDQRLN